MAISTTHKQAETLAFIERYQADNNGVSPSFEELKDALQLKSKSGVHRLIEGLVERGRLTRLPNRARSFQIVKDDVLAGIPTRVLIAELARRSEERRAA